MMLSINLIYGLAFGIEHDTGDPEDPEDYVWAIAVHVGIFRFVFMSFK